MHQLRTHISILVAVQYENAENKPAVAAYAGGAVSAILFAEWLIHRPGLNIVSPAGPVVWLLRTDT